MLVYLDSDMLVSPHLFMVFALFILILTGLGFLSEVFLPLLLVLGYCFLPAHEVQLLLSGLFSGNIHLLISVMAISTLLQNSVLIQRSMLSLLYRFAYRPRLIEFVLFFAGIFLTPILTAQSTRIALMAPFLEKVIKQTAAQETSRAVNAFSNAAFNGCILLSTVFLSGKSSNYVLFSLLGSKQALPNGWFTWLLFASFPGLLLIFAFLIIQFLSFKSDIKTPLNRYTLAKEITRFKTNTYQENTVLVMILTLICGVFLHFFLPISYFILCLIIILIPMLTGVVKWQSLPSLVNWKLAGYLASISGIMNFMASLDFSAYHLSDLAFVNALTASPVYCLFFIFVVSWFINLVFGTMIAPSLAFSLLYPLLQDCAIHLWVVAFVILMATESWIFPYQSTYYLCFRKIMNQNREFKPEPLLRVNAYLSLMKFLIVFASIPFWQSLGILGG